MIIWKEFTFQAAHRLPNVPEDHKCGRLHGHSYTVQIFVTGPVDKRSGWIVDFAYVANAFEPLRRKLDHAFLNDMIENPTSENLAAWIWREILPMLHGLCRIVVQETPQSGCIYEGEPC